MTYQEAREIRRELGNDISHAVMMGVIKAVGAVSAAYIAVDRFFHGDWIIGCLGFGIALAMFFIL